MTQAKDLSPEIKFRIEFHGPHGVFLSQNVYQILKEQPLKHKSTLQCVDEYGNNTCVWKEYTVQIEKVYYKVVRRLDGQLISVNSRLMQKSNPYRTVYVPNVKTLPNIKNTKLYLFADLNYATRFQYDMRYEYEPIEIWECKAENVEPSELIAEASDVEDFWKVYNEKDFKQKSEFGSEYIIAKNGSKAYLQKIKGTHWCDSITLIRKII